MASPAKITSPALGRSTLVIRLKTVDLPAPLGPITARISPRSTVKSTPSTATSAPKRRTSPLHSSSGTRRLLAPVRDRNRAPDAQPARQNAPDALWREHDEDDEDGAEDERPQVSHLGEVMLEKHEGYAAQDRADQRAGASHHHHDEDPARSQPEEQLG